MAPSTIMHRLHLILCLRYGMVTFATCIVLGCLVWTPSHGFLFHQRRPSFLRSQSSWRPAGELRRGSIHAVSTNGTSGIEASARTAAPPFEYDWKDQWYALTFASYVPDPSRSAETVPASVFGHPLVLWRSEDGGPISCADDVCPHRSAALSEGRVRDGRVECLYHGWQFRGVKNGDSGDDDAGSCAFIPQLEKGASIPKSACLRMRDARTVEGIVWVWMGDSPATIDPPRQGDGLDVETGLKDGAVVNDFQIDLPYDHSFLVENLIDPAHIPISHDRTPGGGKRESAEAYEMIIDRDSVDSRGFTGRYRTESSKAKDGPWIEVRYEAPGIIRQTGRPRANIQFGAALHCMPLSLGRSRLLFRAYVSGLPKLAQTLLSMTPKFLRNLNSCKILEQDVGLITTQEDHFARDRDRVLRDDFILLKSSDRFVSAYREWLNRVGDGMPWFHGLARRSRNADGHLTGLETPPALDPFGHRASNQMETRYHRHVVHCPVTRNALRKVTMFKKASAALAILAVTAATGLASNAAGGCGMVATSHEIVLRRALSVAVPAVPLFSIAAALLHRLEQRFFVSFKRRDQLRTEAGT